MNSHLRSALFLFFLGCLSVMGCKETDPREALEKYLRQEARLADFGWSLYAVEEKTPGLMAYVVQPQTGGRVAPVASELKRICPDAKRHDFWETTQLTSFDLVLIKNVDAAQGNAKRLAQVTCDDAFDLAAFERDSLASEEKSERDVADKDDASAPPGPSYPVRDALPQADVQFYAVDARVEVVEPLADMRYEFPPGDLERIKNLIERFSAREIDTGGMTVYYPHFVNTLGASVPYFENASLSPPDKETFSKCYYQNGSIRVESEVKEGQERFKRGIFYNDHGAPVVAIQRWGYDNQRVWATVLEYDARGYLCRVTHHMDGHKQFFRVSIFEADPDYDNARKYKFENEDGVFRLTGRISHTRQSSYAWDADTGEERRYTPTRFRDALNFLGRYPSLASVVPIPE